MNKPLIAVLFWLQIISAASKVGAAPLHVGDQRQVFIDAGKPLRLRFVMRNADLYAFQFRKPSVLKDSR
jgi:hypothetical protein